MRCRWVILALALITGTAAQDPYSILGIHHKATLPEIRKAYRRLAKEWHPDRNEDAKASKIFVEINQAYEILSNAEKRTEYDLTITRATDRGQRAPEDEKPYYENQRYSNDPFDEFSNRFRNPDPDMNLYHKLSVTSRHFDNILENSVHTPALVLFYSEWCMECMRMAGLWRRLVEALQSIEVTAATVHAVHEATLASKTGVYSLPCLVLALNKETYIYTENIVSTANILEFIRGKCPYKLVTQINDTNLEKFVYDYDNQVKALIFEERSTMRLRYLIMAYHYRDRLAFGFVDMTSGNTANVISRYKVERNVDTMVILKEDSGRPATYISMPELPTLSLSLLIRRNQFLSLLRLSSQSVLERVCPVERRVARRRLCCVLVLREPGAAAGEDAREKLRQFAATSDVESERLRYAYIYTHTQTQFLKALAGGSGDEMAGSDTTRMVHRIVVIWRREASRLQYEWLNETWPVSDAGRDDDPEEQERLNETTRALLKLINKLLKPTEKLTYTAKNVKDLVDEAGASAVWRLLVAEWAERAQAAYTVFANRTLELAERAKVAYESMWRGFMEWTSKLTMPADHILTITIGFVFGFGR